MARVHFASSVVWPVWAVALAAASALQAQAPDGESSQVKARSHTIVGEVVRVDVGRGAVTLKSGGQQPQEYELAVEEGTRITSGGRVARLEDLRGGERVLATCSDDADGRHRARALKIGPSRSAAPAPPSATPRP